MIILAPISVGELVDKITILELKLTHATDPRALEHVQHELDQLLMLLEQNQLVDKVAELNSKTSMHSYGTPRVLNADVKENKHS